RNKHSRQNRNSRKLRRSCMLTKALVDELSQEKEQLLAKLAAVSKLKDKKETTKVLRSFSGEAEQFNQLVANARSAISGVAWATKEALSQWYRGDRFQPGNDC